MRCLRACARKRVRRFRFCRHDAIVFIFFHFRFADAALIFVSLFSFSFRHFFRYFISTPLPRDADAIMPLRCRHVFLSLLPPFRCRHFH
jgi:hypothetical protein